LYQHLWEYGARGVEIARGLAYARYWSGRPDLAKEPLARLLALRPGDPEGVALEGRLISEQRLGLSADHVSSWDSDHLRVATSRAAYRQAIGDRDILALTARVDGVRDRSGSFTLRRWGLGEERIWSDLWSTHAFMEVEDKTGDDPLRVMGDAWATFRPTERLRLDASVTRDRFLTQRAIASDILFTSIAASAGWQPGGRWGIEAAHRRSFVSDRNRLDRSGASVFLRVLRLSGLRLTPALDAQRVTSAKDLDHGYYDPRSYEEAAAGFDVEWTSPAALQVFVRQRTGVEHERHNDATPFTILTGRVEGTIARQIACGLGGSYSDSNLASDTGYRRSTVFADLTVHF
jgi:hypothetical protein